jgi:hypothetical protein
VTEFSKEVKVGAPATPPETERNRFVSWESAAQLANKPRVEILTPKTSKSHGSPSFASRTTKSIVAVSLTLLYTVFKIGYEVAKFFTRRLSTFTRFFFGSDQAK